MRSDNLKRHMNVYEIKFLDEEDASFNKLDMNDISRTFKSFNVTIRKS